MEFTVSLVASALTAPILAGAVPVEGGRVRVQPAKSVDDNSRQMLEGKFDVAEMSLATFVRAVDTGAGLIGLPVFPGRRFVQPGMLVRRDAGIASPRELAGHRVALPQYWLTSSVWHRGLLRHEYGVAEDSIEWLTVAAERGATPHPAGVRVAAGGGPSVAQLFAERRIDAALIPRTLTPELEQAGAACLFADPLAAEREYYARTHIFPIMHFIAMRRDAHERAPWLAGALCAAFARAHATVPSEDSPLGLARNRKVLELFASHAREQGLVRSLPPIEQLFVSDQAMEHARA